MTPERFTIDVHGGASDDGAMTLHAWRLPFALDPLIREAKRRARQRRVLGVLGVVLAAGLVAGLTLALRSPGGTPSGGLATARYPQDGVSFRYPSGLNSVKLCGSNGNGLIGVVAPIALLTTGQATTNCPSASPIPAIWPPLGRLGTGGVRILLTRVETWPSAYRPNWHGRLGIWRSAYPSSSHSTFGCPLGVQHETRSIAIRSSNRSEIVGSKPLRPEVVSVDALICGPDFATGRGAFRQIVASTRFTR
jgi:hypothetical protein